MDNLNELDLYAPIQSDVIDSFSIKGYEDQNKEIASVSDFIPSYNKIVFSFNNSYKYAFENINYIVYDDNFSYQNGFCKKKINDLDLISINKQRFSFFKCIKDFKHLNFNIKKQDDSFDLWWKQRKWDKVHTSILWAFIISIIIYYCVSAIVLQELSLNHNNAYVKIFKQDDFVIIHSLNILGNILVFSAFLYLLYIFSFSLKCKKHALSLIYLRKDLLSNEIGILLNPKKDDLKNADFYKFYKPNRKNRVSNNNDDFIYNTQQTQALRNSILHYYASNKMIDYLLDYVIDVFLELFKKRFIFYFVFVILMIFYSCVCLIIAYLKPAFICDLDIAFSVFVSLAFIGQMFVQ